MKLYELLQKLNPMGKASFQKVTTEIDPIELRHADAFSPKSLELRLIDSDSEDENPHQSPTRRNFVVPPSDADRSIYNSPTVETISSPISYSDNPSAIMEGSALDSASGHPSSYQQNSQDNNGEQPLLGSSPTPEQRNKCRLGGIHLFLIMAMLIFVFTILLTVTTIFILDSISMSKNKSKSEQEESNNDHRLQMPNWPIEDVQEQNTEHDQYNSAIFYLDNSTEASKELHHHHNHPKHNTLENRVITLEEVRQMYKDALETTVNNEAVTGEDNKDMLLAHHSFVMEKAYEEIIKREKMSELDAEEGGVFINITLPQDLCPKFIQEYNHFFCNESQIYRSFDGTCNNKKQHEWGSVDQVYRRMVFPTYNDGISSPRIMSVLKNKTLPNAREVSHIILIDAHREDKTASMMLPFWAQLLSYDIINTATLPLIEGGCCGTEAVAKNSNCFPIPVSPNDPFYYAIHNISCLDFQRAAPHGSCKFGPREHYNKATAFIDASHMYGVNEEISKNLRTGVSGEMKLYNSGDGLYLLPLLNDTASNSKCFPRYVSSFSPNLDLNNSLCFQAGDERVNDLLSVTALHTIFVRHHNRIAGQLGRLNLHWDDEKLFQETRKIIIAQIQHITYNEFLPALLNDEVRTGSDIKLLPENYYTKFNVDLNPQISNVFSISFQFFISMIQGLLVQLNSHRTTSRYSQFHKLVMNPMLLMTSDKIDELLLGASDQSAAKVDAFITGQITYNMYQPPGKSHGTDLTALIIQQGRDQGIPPYVAFRKVCTNGSEPKDFQDLTDSWESLALNRTKEAYASLMDVDLFVGILAELPMSNSKLGPTLSCIIADQFARLRQGDMFWYEGDILKYHFNTEQLKSIRRTTLAKIICENSDHIRKLQRNLMLIPSDLNPLTRCADIPKVNLNAWKELSIDQHHHNKEENDPYDDLDVFDSDEDSAEHFNNNHHKVLDFTQTSTIKDHPKGLQIIGPTVVNDTLNKKGRSQHS